jgi:hypothetical protein
VIINRHVREDIRTKSHMGTAIDCRGPLIVHGPNFWVEGLSASRSVARCSPRDLISPTSVRNRHRNGESGAASTDGPSIGRWQVAVRTSRAPSPQIAVLMLRAKWHRPSQRLRSYPRVNNFLHLEDFQCKTYSVHPGGDSWEPLPPLWQQATSSRSIQKEMAPE